MATVNPESGTVLEGKYKGCFVYIWEENNSLSIHSERTKNSIWGNNWDYTRKFTISKETIKAVQDMGTSVQKANPEAALKAGFWFGVGAAIAASTMSNISYHLVAVEYLDGEKSLLQLKPMAYTTFKSIEFAIQNSQ